MFFQHLKPPLKVFFMGEKHLKGLMASDAYFNLNIVLHKYL